MPASKASALSAGKAREASGARLVCPRSRLKPPFLRPRDQEAYRRVPSAALTSARARPVQASSLTVSDWFRPLNAGFDHGRHKVALLTPLASAAAQARPPSVL